MAAKVIAVVNQKGGSGKTTLAMLLAGSLGDAGHRVMVADADPQNTSLRWASAGDAFPADVEDVSGEEGKLHKELRRRLEEYDYIVIDSPPAATAPVTESALKLAHLALVPVIPSPLDLWASEMIREAIFRAQEKNPTLQARLVMNQLQPNTLISREVIGLLPDFGIPLLSATLRQRTVYKECATEGHSIEGLGSRAQMAAKEVDFLKRRVLALLRRIDNT
ncbi:plasmid segregation oscillating ATPase ParF [Sulfuritortus calidifontis]|uniref:Plasmid segregation oscillating ATPase ParF n=1 Tax=Sulfuritortus calidifontis TaxID=1914471 RepID=A0A4R3JZ11_9PROT|nr:ParA family partition ATPase [Sulfuritortus calidifontis]TCS72981.1 plasmid segregation oscillating ATPase ParF [Sulfuritortus calidifontis]